MDDTASNRYALGRALTKAGFDVSEAANGRDGLDHAVQAQPDLIVLDVQLPDISGYEVCRLLKADRSTARIPVLQVSAHFKDVEELDCGMASGADNCLAQPVEPLVLISTVRALLRASRSERALHRLNRRLAGEIEERKRGEEALRRSEAKWNAAIEHFGEGAIIATETEQVIYWNPAARRMHGFSSETEGIEPLKETPNTFELWTPDGSHRLDLEEWPMKRIKRGEAVRNLELRLRRPDQGWEKVVSYSGAMVDTAGGERLIFLSVYDLTERRKAEAALEAERARLQAVLEALPVAVWIADENCTVVQANRAVDRVWGQAVIPYDIEGYREYKGWWADTGKPLQPQDWALARAVMKGEVSVGEVIDIERFNGARGTILNNAAPIRDRDGRTIGGVAVAQDITEQKRAEEAVRQSEERFRALVEASAQVVWTIDAQGIDYEDSPSWRAFTGQSVQEYLKGAWNALHPDDRERAGAHWRQCLAARMPYEIEYRLRHHSGEYRWMQVRAIPLLHTNGTLKTWVGMSTDITEQRQAQEALRESESLLRKTIAAPTVGVSFFSLGGRIHKANETFARMTGYSRDELVNATSWQMLTAPEFRDAGKRAATDLAERGETVPYEKQMVRKDGSRWWGLSAPQCLSGSGWNAECVEFIIDITERKQAEAELAEARRRLDSALIGGDVGIFEWDVAGERVWGDSNFARMFGLQLDERGAAPVADYVAAMHPDDQERVRRRIALTAETGADYEAEYRVVSGGQSRWLLARAKPELDAAGRVVRAAGVCLDVTERKEAEEALRQSESQFRQIADTMPQLVWMTRPDGYHEYFNRRWYEYTGSDFDSTRGESWAKLLHPDDYQGTLERWHHSLSTGEPYEVEYRFRRASDGTYRWFLGRALPVRDEQGRIVRWFGTCTEIHEQKQLQEDLAAARRSAEQAKAAAEDASRAKDQFLAVLSHELRTPLTPVVAAVSMLQKQWRGDQASHDTLEMIHRNVELEARLIDDLLDVTRITRGKIELDHRPVMLCEVIRRAVDVCRPDIEARQLHFSVDIGPDAPYLIHADAARLQQVFWNLLKNAVKFTQHGGCVGIRCRLDGHSVVAEVMDNGEGIDSEVLPTVFNPFEQGSTRVTRQFGGLGLGLTITRGLVEMHGGSISAHSEGKGKGATFRVRLPIHARDASAPASGVPKGNAVAEHRKPVEPRLLRILLVEDHGDTARIMRQLLMADGHEVETAGDVATAMELVTTKPFDLLLSDLGLPDGSGVDLMQRLRERGRTLPGIALSGYGQEEDIRRSHEAGFARHLTKPISPDRLVEAIAIVSGQAGGK